MQAPKSPTHYRMVEKNTHDPEPSDGLVTMTGTGGHDSGITGHDPGTSEIHSQKSRWSRSSE
ncbi:hypothetical protein DBV39_14590 [Orrella marina]|uniref:Uncharacterized protein n=1 Tax=Orrella marina TaxID=2163011 RepID=A0A2R4XLR5_9BURK|nr:hypothetical protein DBV39_14590 [Orrella marina]